MTQIQNFSVSVLLLALIFVVKPAQAIEAVIIGKDGRTLASVAAQVDLGRSVGAITVDVLNEARATQQIRAFEAYEEGLVSINDLGSELELVSRTEIKAWGWCFAINDQVAETLPEQTRFVSQRDRLTWFYGYAHYRDGEWVAQCVREDVPKVSSSSQKNNRM